MRTTMVDKMWITLRIKIAYASKRRKRNLSRAGNDLLAERIYLLGRIYGSSCRGSMKLLHKLCTDTYISYYKITLYAKNRFRCKGREEMREAALRIVLLL